MRMPRVIRGILVMTVFMMLNQKLRPLLFAGAGLPDGAGLADGELKLFVGGRRFTSPALMFPRSRLKSDAPTEGRPLLNEGWFPLEGRCQLLPPAF